ncbi:MAG: IPT/TIG domain-containing protein [Treponema sp.]|nr:IPT/TIG domain-containing protein [Treponema sp.]
MRTKASVRFGSFFSIVILYVVVSSLLGMESLKKKKAVISSITPAIGSSEELMTIRGSGFGDEQEESYVSIAGFRVTSSHYVSWSDEEIKLNIPYNVQDGLVKVVTRRGESEPSFFANRSNIPESVRSDLQSRIPLITAIEPETASPGDLITIKGSNFGVSRLSSDILFSTDRLDSVVPASLCEYPWNYWRDNEIRVRVPDGAATGVIAVRTAKGDSQGYPFGVSTSAGNKHYVDRKIYVIKTSLDIENEKEESLGEITLYMPRPALSASQPSAEYKEVKPDALIDNDRGEIVFRTREMSGKGNKQTFSASSVITVYSVESHVYDNKSPAYSSETLSLYKSCLQADSNVPADDKTVVDLAAKIVGKEKNCYKKARLLFDYMRGNYKLQDSLRNGMADPLDLIKRKSGDCFDFSAVYAALCRSCSVAAVQLTGIVVDEKGKSHIHCWNEIYLEDFGWFPVDLSFACGLKYNDFPSREDYGEYYFGNMDSHHIAYSRGEKVIKSSMANNRIVRRPRSWCMQTLWEESATAQSSYSSYWTDPIVTGIY